MKENIKMWLMSRFDTPVVKNIVGEKAFLMRTGAEIPAPFVVVDSFRVSYQAAREGTFPVSCSFSVMCVAKTAEEAAALSAAVRSVVDNGYVLAEDALIRVTDEEERYGFAEGVFVNELNFTTL